MNSKFQTLLKNIRNCQVCIQHLPLGCNPIVQISQHSKILIVGQAPGAKVHKSSVPWDDNSGDRLRSWLNLSKEVFYDHNNIAIVPMGFCYPGKDKNGGDKPPIKECASLWHESILRFLTQIELILLVGSYAHKYYLKQKIKPTLDETVRSYQEYLPHFFVLPHPSWRNTGWIKRNPWFDESLLPTLQKRIHAILNKNGVNALKNNRNVKCIQLLQKQK